MPGLGSAGVEGWRWGLGYAPPGYRKRPFYADACWLASYTTCVYHPLLLCRLEGYGPKLPRLVLRFQVRTKVKCRPRQMLTHASAYCGIVDGIYNFTDDAKERRSRMARPHCCQHLCDVRRARHSDGAGREHRPIGCNFKSRDASVQGTKPKVVRPLRVATCEAQREATLLKRASLC